MATSAVVVFCAVCLPVLLVSGSSVRFDRYANEAASSDETFNFLVMGDWGGLPDFPYRTPIEKSVAGQMGKLANAINSKFMLALGDNFYFDGVKDVNDKRFKETYEEVFTSQSLDHDWYFVAGNHDWNGNVSAQIAYSLLHKRWNYPDFYYGLNFTLPGGGRLEILMIDTVMLCGNSDDDRLHQQPDGYLSVRDAEQHWKWIEGALKNSKADFLVVAGHYPVISIAEHGPTHCLTERLQPMLYKYNVSAYFCGHEHNIQHLELKQDGHTVEYFISGAANFIDTSTAHQNAVPKGSSKFHWANDLSLGAFSYVNMTSQRMTFNFIEANGKFLYAKDVLPRKV